MPDMPCIAHNLPCPYLDRSGKQSAWTCCGEQHKLQRIVNMRECPALPVAREIYKKHCTGRPEAKK